MNLSTIKITPILDSLKLQKINDEEYFSEKYNGYISNSRLSLINPEQDNNPKAFFEGLGKHKIYSDALEFGSAVHELTLQPESFELAPDLNKPTAKMGFMADILYKSFLKDKVNDKTIIAASNEIDYYKGKMTEDRINDVKDKCETYWKCRKSYEQDLDSNKTQIYLDLKSAYRVIECINALNENKQIQNLLHPKGLISDPISESEQAILLDVEVQIPNIDPFILRLKAKLDNYTIDNETNTITVNDVKTIGKIVSEFSNNFSKFRYYRELAIYSWLLSLVAQKYYNMSNPKIESNCLIVSTIPAFYTKVYKLVSEDFVKGWNEFKYLLKLVAYYYGVEGYRF